VSSLISLNKTAPAQGRVRRQSAESTTPLVYNVTQIFPASENTTCTLTAWAAVTTPADSSDCFLTICGDNDCGFPLPITTYYTRFTYKYLSPIDEDSALATFSVECSTSAYVALDDVSVTDNALAANASSSNSASPVSTATTTVFMTETVVQTQIFTQLETTTFISGSEVVFTTTVPTVVYQTVNVPTTKTRTVSTLLLTTETATTAIPQYLNVTVSNGSTTTSEYKFYCFSAPLPYFLELTGHSHANNNPQLDRGIVSAFVGRRDRICNLNGSVHYYSAWCYIASFDSLPRSIDCLRDAKPVHCGDHPRAISRNHHASASDCDLDTGPWNCDTGLVSEHD